MICIVILGDVINIGGGGIPHITILVSYNDKQ